MSVFRAPCSGLLLGGGGRADLKLVGPGGMQGSLSLRWTQAAVANARGELAGKVIVAEAPAP